MLVSDIYLLADGDSSVLQAIAKKGIFTIQKQKLSRITDRSESQQPEAMDPLSDMQVNAIDDIKTILAAEKPCLLHGITGSGKTRVYAELIKDAIENEKQTLYLLPEIALTTHMVERLKTIFGADVLVYHSSALMLTELLNVVGTVKAAVSVAYQSLAGLRFCFTTLRLPRLGRQ